MSTRPGPDTSLRPVPWRRMAWVTWQQQQLTLAGVGALLSAAAVYPLITGLRMHHAYAAVTACRPASSGICRQVANNFLNTYAPGAGVTAALLQVVPALIGAFAGAPVLAREFEPAPSGTPGPRASDGYGGPSRSLCRSQWRSPSRPQRSACSSPGTTGRSSAREAAARSLPPSSTYAGSRSPPGRWPRSQLASWPAS